MSVLLVAYDQASAGANEISASLRSQPGWARFSDGVYVVTTPLTAPQLRDQLNSTYNVKVLVYDVTNSLWAANHLPVEVSQWLQNNWRQG
jgi:hypothetical protein